MKQIALTAAVALLLAGGIACKAAPVQPSPETDAPVTDRVRLEPVGAREEVSASFESYPAILRLYAELAEMIPDEQQVLGDRFDIQDETQREWIDRLFVSLLALCPRTGDGSAPEPGNFGYAIVDLNRDGTDELVWLTSEGTVMAIFSCRDGVPVLVECFYNRYRCQIAADGLIYTCGSSSAWETTYRICQLSQTDRSLSVLAEFGTDGYDSVTGETVYYFTADGNRVSVSAQEYRVYLDRMPYSSPDDAAPFDFSAFYTPLPAHSGCWMEGKDGK